MLSRVPPRMGVTAYRTFSVSSPIQTHYKSVTCKEAECQQYKFGWTTGLDITNAQQAEAATWIRMHSGLSFTFFETGNLVTFNFPPGQTCFIGQRGGHKVPLGKPELYVVRDGDHRGNPTGKVRKHTKPDLFVEEMAGNLTHLSDEIQKG
jgi:hypothetical protein